MVTRGAGAGTGGAAHRSGVAVLENSVEVGRSCAEVFDYCSDIRNELEWNPTMRSVELLTPEPVQAGSRYRARWKGGPENILVCVEFERPHRWVHVSESSMWRVSFEGRVLEAVDGSRLRTRMEIVPRGAGRLAFPAFRRLMQRQERANMTHIRRALDPGAAPADGSRP